MSDITEGIGAAIEGALAGRAVEPKHGEGAQKPGLGDQHGGACLNCGAQPQGAFCQNCGQKVHVHRTLSAIGHDLLHGVLHLDGKFWATLPLLLFKPGKLTRRYIEGERAKFVSPMAMFLFSVFAMFAVFQIVGISAPSDFDPGANLGKTAETIQTQGEAEAERLRERMDALPEDDPQRAELQETLDSLDQVLNGASQIAQDTPDGGDGQWDINLTGIEALDKGLAKKWNENPGLMVYKLQANAYKFSWLLIPLSIPFVWLTFAWKRRFKAYDHAIFVTYSLAFMSLLFILASILGAAGVPAPAIVLSMMLIPPIHLYKQLRGAYELSRLSALWRLMVLSGFIWIVALLFLQVLLTLGAF